MKPESKYPHYCIVESDYRGSKLEEKVNSLINQGYVPQGGPFKYGSRLYQAMIKFSSLNGIS